MLGWLRKPDKRDGLWKDIIARHFELNGSKVVASVRQWAEVNPQIESYDGIGAGMFGIQNLLKELDKAVFGSKR